MKRRRRRRYNNHLWLYSIITCICLLTMGIGYALLSAENNFNIDVTKTTLPGAGDTIKALLGNNTSVASGTGTLEKIEQPATEQTSAQTEYRYRGANPNKYVTFNNETWRIIGVVDGKVKLIRNEWIKYYPWNESGVNEWPGGSLQTYLNEIYYNNLTTEAQSIIEENTWYLGGSSTYQGLYSQDYYKFERGTTTACTTSSSWCPRSTKTTDKIALMYPSDYGYGAPSSCTKDLCNYGTDTNCAASDWLFKGIEEWTLASFSGDSYGVFYVGSSGFVYGNLDIIVSDYSYPVRPVLYLKENVQITGGDGSSSNPYQLTLG